MFCFSGLDLHRSVSGKDFFGGSLSRVRVDPGLSCGAAAGFFGGVSVSPAVSGGGTGVALPDPFALPSGSAAKVGGICDRRTSFGGILRSVRIPYAL